MLIKNNGKIDLRNKKLVKSLLDDAYLNIHIDPTTIINPLRKVPDEFGEDPHLYIQWLMTQPEYFHVFCKEIMGIDLQPFQCVILKEMWNRKFPFLIGSRGMSKTFLLSLYCMIRLLVLQGRKIIICGAAFRQSKILYDYMCTFYNNAPILRDIITGYGDSSGPSRDVDMCSFTIGQSVSRMLPIGLGDKIRGQRANDIICDEINSINQEVLEKVIFGFAAVSSSPSEAVKNKASNRLAKKLGIHVKSTVDEYDKSNQIIMSGTCGYTFQHMYKYWKKWRSIILSRGEPDKIAEVFNGEIPPAFNWTDYSIMRIPFEMLPYGFMDEGVVAQARASIDNSQYSMEYASVFSGDSSGFFKRSLVESCTVSHSNKISHASEKDIIFEPALYGDPNKKYILGIDPASEADKFAIVILEIHPEHRRLVYSWTSNKKDFQTDIKDGFITHTNDFYTYCIYKIRDLLKRFPCDRIIIDPQGGGHMIVEGLKSRDLIKQGELAILPLIVPGKSAITDGDAGLHIIELANFSHAEWISNANHGLKKDLENKVLLFPFVDPVSLELATVSDNATSRLYDSQFDNVYEIDQLKEELSTIVHTATNAGRERWDTPDLKIPGSKTKGRMRKDRYSALLIANMAARVMSLTPSYNVSMEIGGFANGTGDMGGKKFTGPDWLVSKLNDLYD